jgi:hypothetical protein
LLACSIGLRKVMQGPRIARLLSLASEATSKLDVFRLNSDTLGVNCTKIGVFKQADEICFGGLL